MGGGGLIVFARHGETPANRDGLVLGRADPALTELGRVQAELLARVLGGEAPLAVVSSPLRRARQTAAVIAAAAGRPVEVDERLVEVDWGAWEGKPYQSFAPADVEARKDRSPLAPGGESLAAVRARLGPCCEELLERAGDGVVVAVSHVSPIKSAAAWALGVDDAVAWRMRLGIASITRLARRADGQPLLLSFGEMGHLASLGIPPGGITARGGPPPTPAPA